MEQFQVKVGNRDMGSTIVQQAELDSIDNICKGL